MTKGLYIQSRMDSSAEAFCKKPFRPFFPIAISRKHPRSLGMLESLSSNGRYRSWRFRDSQR